MPRIMVVDDDADVRELIELALAGEGYEIASVDGGPAALKQLAQQAYDLIVCDLQMPDVDGRAIYRVIARRPAPRPAFLFVTGYADAGPYREFLSAAQEPVVGKPFDSNVLRGLVRRILS
jgi:CheY-like chemotaxis protein